MYENGSFVPLIQATYRQQINQHQTPEWANGYDYDKDPLWHTEQKANSFDRVWFYHCDHLGTPQEMSDQTGAIVWSAEYKAWGECKPENHIKRDIWDSEIITNNLRFQGQYYDDETGLHYNRYRYYSPYVGRFISKDPIGLLGGINKYQYALNTIYWMDPLGLSPIYTGKKFLDDPNKIPNLFPTATGMKKVVKADGKITYSFGYKCNNYQIEFHPDHGDPTEHFDGDHYHAKKQASCPPKGKTVAPFFRLKNTDPDTKATKGGGTFAAGDLMPIDLRF